MTLTQAFNDAQKLKKRALNYQNVFSKADLSVRGKFLSGEFYSPFLKNERQTMPWSGCGSKGFFKRCVARADNLDRDVDLYHWSSAKFESTWRDTLSVLVARGRAQVGVHSAKTDWSRRILDFQYMDYDDQAAHHA